MPPRTPRPRTHDVEDAPAGTLVWDDARGLGFVIPRPVDPDAGRLVIETDERPEGDNADWWKRPAGPIANVVWLERGDRTAEEGLSVVDDPARLRGELERILASKDDPTVTGVALEWTSIARAQFPRLAGAVVTLQRWRLLDKYHARTHVVADVARAGESLLRCTTRSTYTPCSILANVERHLAVLESDENVAVRSLATCARADLADLARSRAQAGRDEVLDALRAGLARAATQRGVASAERAFGAALLKLRVRWRGCGVDDVFAGIEQQAEALVGEREQALGGAAAERAAAPRSTDESQRRRQT